MSGFLAELRVRHFDVDGTQPAGDPVLVDAAEMLATFMVEGMPDAEIHEHHSHVVAGQGLAAHAHRTTAN
jgi:hypothetical protein